jgi:hypothetical protein
MNCHYNKITLVIPAEAGIHLLKFTMFFWIPTFAGMTVVSPYLYLVLIACSLFVETFYEAINTIYHTACP